MKFSIGFDKRDLKAFHDCVDTIVASNQWAEGRFTKEFEELWAAHNGLHATAFSSWSGAAMAVLEYYKLAGKTVLCPSNTFMATPLATIKAGAKVQFVDCNRSDLCMSFEDFKRKVNEHRPAAVWVVHIGGHIAFEIDAIAEYCRRQGIILLEDCAHAHGAEWNGKKPGQWGDAGVYSFYATKTITTGEGGMLVTCHPDLADFARQYRNYGKFEYKVHGLNHRITEFSAAVGVLQTRRLSEMMAFKNEYAIKLREQYPNALRLPAGMISGYYKFIVFDPIDNSTGKVYDQPCHRILGHAVELPNTDWVAKNHWCVPIYYDRTDDSQA